jgi:predicted DNA-binding transcriptional regulator YafY
MAKKLAYERYYWLHKEIQACHFPNAKKLAETFEISQKQAQRDIEFLRERLDAPLIYNADRRGYEYQSSEFELPPIWITEDELLAFCLSLQLSSNIPDRLLKESLHHFLNKVLSSRSLDAGLSLDSIQEKVSVKNIQSYKVSEAIFHKTLDSLMRNLPITICYYSPFKGEATERTVQPLHLLNYMGNWHLIAYCTLRQDIRDFSLSRIRSLEPASASIAVPSGAISVTDYLNANFGLLKGTESIEISLKFSPEIADWITEQVWHAGQSVSLYEDNSVRLTFPVADFKEIKREILKFGSQVEVLSPESLRQEIQNEIGKMNNIYNPPAQ